MASGLGLAWLPGPGPFLGPSAPILLVGGAGPLLPPWGRVGMSSPGPEKVLLWQEVPAGIPWCSSQGWGRSPQRGTTGPGHLGVPRCTRSDTGAGSRGLGGAGACAGFGSGGTWLARPQRPWGVGPRVPPNAALPPGSPRRACGGPWGGPCCEQVRFSSCAGPAHWPPPHGTAAWGGPRWRQWVEPLPLLLAPEGLTEKPPAQGLLPCPSAVPCPWPTVSPLSKRDRPWRHQELGGMCSNGGPRAWDGDTPVGRKAPSLSRGHYHLLSSARQEAETGPSQT